MPLQPSQEYESLRMDTHDRSTAQSSIYETFIILGLVFTLIRFNIDGAMPLDFSVLILYLKAFMYLA